MLEVTSYLKRD